MEARYYTEQELRQKAYRRSVISKRLATFAKYGWVSKFAQRRKHVDSEVIEHKQLA